MLDVSRFMMATSFRAYGKSPSSIPSTSTCSIKRSSYQTLPAATASIARSISSMPTLDKNPSRPVFTPSTGISVSRTQMAASSTVPSPPMATSKSYPFKAAGSSNASQSLARPMRSSRIRLKLDSTMGAGSNSRMRARMCLMASSYSGANVFPWMAIFILLRNGYCRK